MLEESPKEESVNESQVESTSASVEESKDQPIEKSGKLTFKIASAQLELASERNTTVGFEWNGETNTTTSLKGETPEWNEVSKINDTPNRLL